MRKSVSTYECKTEKYSVRIKTECGKIKRCGYLMKCGKWHYVDSRNMSKREFFCTGEPKNYISTLHHTIKVLYYYDFSQFKKLIESISEDDNEFHSYANHIMQVWDNPMWHDFFEKECLCFNLPTKGTKWR